MSEFKLEAKASIGSSDIEFLTFYKGKKCDHEEVNGKIFERRLALELIFGDLSSCLEYLLLIAENKSSLIWQPLYEAFVIKYGKCFVSGHERGLSLKVGTYFQTDSVFLKTHFSIMKVRNKYIAHSDSDTFETGQVLLAKYGDESEVFVPISKYIAPTDHSLGQEIELCSYLISSVKREIEKLDNKIKS